MQDEVKERNYRVLFIDDSPEILKSFERMFFHEPFDVIKAECGENALDLILSMDLDLIVTDIKMPGIHGLELIEEIRKKNPEIPIIIYSAYKGMKEDWAVKVSNIEAYFIKPNDYNRLYRKIQDMASKKRLNTMPS